MTFEKKHGAYIGAGGAKKLKANAKQWDALVETMVIASCIDGSLAPGEPEALAALILALPGFEKLDNKGLAKMVQDIASRVGKDGLESRVTSIASALHNDDALSAEAFTLATMFVHWDGEVGEEEQTFLDLLQKALTISDEKASDIDARLTEWTDKALRS